MDRVFETKDESQTKNLGIALGKLLKAGDFLALVGDLGTGKTALAKGVAEGLGIKEDVTSPTFTIINQYDAKVPLAHMDAYRLKDPEELENAGYEDCLEDFVVVLEWADLVKELLPEDVLWIEFEVVSDNTRRIKLSSKSAHFDKILQELKL